MENEKKPYGHIPVIRQSFAEAEADLQERIRHGERKYGISSEQMLERVSTGEEEWETLEILKWMSAFRAYQSLLAKATPMDGTASTTTGMSTSGD